MAERGSWLQCVGYQAIFEEARRQKPACSMALNWCFNEPWPVAAGNSLVNWPARPKPAYHAARLACRPVLASARFAKFQWKAGEEFSAEIWMLNDAPAELPPGEVQVCLVAAGTSRVLLNWKFPGIGAARNLAGPSVHALLPSAETGEFELVLKVLPRDEWGTSYRLSLCGKTPK
jgi:beta-mannosidase